MKARILLLALILCVFSSTDIEAQDLDRPELISLPEIDLEIEVLRDQEEWNLSWSISTLEKDRVQLDLHFESQTPVSPKEVLLKWKMPSKGAAGLWHPVLGQDKSLKPDWMSDVVQSRAAVDAPIIGYFSYEDKNLLTVACSDAVNKIGMHGAIREEDAMLHSRVRLFSEAIPSTTDYQVSILFDMRNIPYDQALQSVAQWWETFEHLSPAEVPDAARLPMYSTWYSYHQSISEKPLIAECEKAKELGYETIIVDDGWQTMDSNRGYAYTGDWNPDRIPNMAGFVEDVHETGMKIMLWYSVPFVGTKSQAYEQFKGKFLYERKGLDAFVLDPRYPEVRNYLIDTYKKALVNWDLDGFKLDFIDDFHAVDSTELTAENGRDFASVNEAVDQMMTDILRELKNIKPDILIEFRQKYIGPSMRKYGNMFRAADCPNDAVTNRVRITDLRLTSGKTAVHSDMLMWDVNQSAEVAALQLLNVMFSVPQLSVRLDDLPEEHYQMVQFYTDYWIENRAILLDGQFTAKQPMSNYPVVSAKKEDHLIVGLYADEWLTLDQTAQKIDIINGKGSKEIIFNNEGKSRTYSVTIYDCQGNIASSKKIELKSGANLLDVPPSGLLRLVSLK